MKNKRSWAMGLAILGGSSLLAACGSTSTAKAPAKSGKVSSSASQASYFKGKTITLIAPDKPGGGYDRWARLAAPFLQKALGATIKVVNAPGAGTVVGTNELYHSAPNGLTIGLVDVSGDIGNKVENKKGQQFNLTKFQYLGQPTTNVVAVFANPASPYHSISALEHAKGPVKVLDIASGVGDVTNRVVLGALGVHMQLVTGYNNGKTLETGFLRGDGPIASGTYSSWYSVVKAKKALPLMVTWMGATWSGAPGVPTLGHIMKTQKLSSKAKAALLATGKLVELGYDFAVPPGVPAARVAALRAAFASMVKSPAFIQKAKAVKLNVQYVSGTKVGSDIQSILSNTTAISAYLK